MAVNKNLQLIQALRGIASLLVVFYHVTANSAEVLKANFLFGFFEFGGAGVDIFFVLSGFIITYTSLGMITQRNKLPHFIYRRFVRIFPTYWIIISLFLAVQLLLPGFYKTPFSFDLLSVLSTYLLFPGHIMVNGVSWTLSYELFFYIVFSFAFIIPNKRTAFIAASVSSLVIILLPLLGYNYTNENIWMSLITNPMNIEFFLGIISAIVISYIPQAAGRVFIICGTIAFIFSGLVINNGYQLLSNSFNRVILFGIPSFFIIAGVVKYELTNSISLPKIILKLGDASYSLYLLHLPLVAAACKVLSLLNINNTVWLHIILIAAIIIICFISILFYDLFEKPAINKLTRIRRVKVENEI